MVRKALIFGIAGQDGSYLAEHLLSEGYEVYGVIRRASVPEHQETRIHHLNSLIHTMYGDVQDDTSVVEAIRNSSPDEIYNLAAQSHVRISFDIPRLTVMTNGIGTLNVLEAARLYAPHARVYQASSSEMFGNSVDPDGFQRETTPMHPTSPYGCAKLFAYNLARHYRKAYGMFVSNGILFNHESPRRGSNFVTAKVVKAAVRIRAGKQDSVSLGNMDSYRDWGHSKDYVRAMHMILNHDEPDDFVVASGESRSVRDLCKYVFYRMGLPYHRYVKQDPKYMRPEELKYLRGDSSKIRKVLGWSPVYKFESLIDEMIEWWESVEEGKSD